ncbi:3D domain-containing protein [Bacillus haynesii]|uniref:LysM peptidoglycan-binding domain-containing protein n=2 Tax=Bacillus haynesii TaxID=1925021 RepID=A0AA90JHL7_9BACI|nr:LysM peptidoglycan-binding and 3D domain-containing protein [Bacillus haynesii]MCY7755781.1 LysM peptidoglycan-binding domain-containing protein [Bacillus haynesii]MCY7770298.1 LysM peptidoglycan-binding domain-containing protein [Bacillus haynesii]MCY7849988.1 LysM peptidoglycan-binding domain-containing protein [Bacillus haynesii]MCY7859629.1 LysM peptidoglycan-binding domain-containing protein [Bacillus haynesii]MCY7915378.1 LysM peptidoglycan-binding domain-containing protein [Bacillus 
MKKTFMSFVAVAALSSTAFGASASAKEITVQKGDTLWGISQKQGVNLQDLKEWNQLSSDLIIPGQKLNVSEKQTEEKKQYTIKKGDTLWKIAQQFGVSVNDLKNWNNIKSDIIYPNTSITVDGQATVQAAAAQPAETKPAVQKEAKVEQAAPKQEKETTSRSNESQSAAKELTVTATAYTANDGGMTGVTATGIDLKANKNAKVIAVDPNVIPLGSKVYVEGYGEATAADTGGAIKGNKIDVFVPSKSAAKNWGVKTVKVKVLK